MVGPISQSFRPLIYTHFFTDYAVNAEKYSDRSPDVRTEPSEVRTKSQGPNSALTKQSVNKSFII